MPSIQWIQESEPAVGENHPALADVINRPLKQLLANSGFSPNDPNIVLLGAVGDGINIQPTVISRISTPPAVPNNGDTYIVLPTGTGDWLGRDNNIAIWNGATLSWSFYIPDTGWKVYSTADGFEYEFNGSVWTSDYTIGGNLVVGGNLTIDGTTHGVGAAQFDSTMTVTDETFLSDVETSGIGYFGFTKASMAPYIESGDSLWAFTRAAVIRLNNSGTLKLGRVNGAIATPTQILSGQELGVFSFRGYNTDTTAFSQTAAVKGFAGSDWSGTNQESFIVFITTPNGSTSNMGRWTIQSAGHFVANTDNVYDIGASGANRPRNLYLGTSGYFPVAAIFGTNPASTGYVRLPNVGYIYSRNHANTGDIQLLGLDINDNIVVGDPVYAGTFTITLQTNSAPRGWKIDNAGALTPLVDNVQVLGKTAFRVGQVVVGNNITIGGAITATVGAISFSNNIGIYWRDSTNSFNVGILLDNTDTLQIGTGVTAIGFNANVLPSADATYTLGSNTLRWSSGSFSSYVEVGTSPATSGHIRLPGSATISAFFPTNGSQPLISISGNDINIGHTTGISNSSNILFNMGHDTPWFIAVGLGGAFSPGTSNTYDIGNSFNAVRTIYTFNIDTVSANLVFKRAGTTQLTLAASAATFAGTVTGTTITGTTRLTAPKHGTTTNVDVIFDRNSVTQLTLKSLIATFAGSVQATTDNTQDLGITTIRWRDIFASRLRLIDSAAASTVGQVTLVGGTKVVSTTAVTATSRIFLTSDAPGGTIGFLSVSARVAGTSFTILSSNALDTSDVSWLIIEPA